MKKIELFPFAVICIFIFLFSCKGSESDEGNTTITYLTVSSEGGNEKLLGKTFTFKVKDNLTNDITSESQIYVNNQLINGNQYTPTEKGAYTVYARYKDLPVNPLSVTAILSEGINFKHRILYEDFTGTWCGNCPRGGARAKNLTTQTDDGYVFLGIHGPKGTKDPWANTTSTEMENFKNVTEWPTMFINRNTSWPDTEDYTDMSIPLGQLKATSKIGIKIGSIISGNTLEANIQISFAQNYTNLKVAALIAEDNLIGEQHNYIPALGPKIIPNYIHHNVLQSRLTSSVAGDDISGTQTMISNEYSKTFQYSIPSGFNRNNLKIIVMVLDGNGTVLNVREEKIGIKNNYEFL